MTPVRGDWALMFSNHSWTLLPDPKILLQITQKLISLKKRQRNAKPRAVIKHDEYEYTFIALDLQGAQIARETSAETTATYAPPYSSFPNLFLPTHPYLVIHHALQAFEKHDPSAEEHIRIHNDMLRIKKLWSELEQFSVDDGDGLNVASANGGARDRVNTRRHTMANPYPTPRNV
ncbi:hypothetical protein K474DRAFT_1660697 [Panus rudis PR-1116 ss-1]|nr:hypothetical protein K474DRAFT_1660697 [Panus rudis PR-1116 ss-1]